MKTRRRTSQLVGRLVQVQGSRWRDDYTMRRIDNIHTQEGIQNDDKDSTSTLDFKEIQDQRKELNNAKEENHMEYTTRTRELMQGDVKMHKHKTIAT